VSITLAAAYQYECSNCYDKFAGCDMKDQQNSNRHPEWLAAAGVSLMLLLASGGVAAQQAPHACGAGPGPNEIMAGVQPGGNGVAPTPLCYWKSGAGAQQAAPQPTGYWKTTWGRLQEIRLREF
jgi:hypothetical protein